ncbi:nardilysin isoform X2 [Leptinotarsa decemlineata]|uniref:nardilysin isoform X2 n=1 Tax=Leptinotarsa decemlineata TaxID=7539 RepID=UPI003D30980F
MSVLKNFNFFFEKIGSKKIILNFSSRKNIFIRNKKRKHISNMNTILGNEAKGFKILPSPTKSVSDKKDYTVIKLENGLTACLISDKAPVSLADESCEELDNESETDDSNYSGSSDSEVESDSSGSIQSKSVNSELKMAAAGLCIGVGSYSDPIEVPGMAHFLEHMVFMGSEKFPAENDFDSFIKKGGGSDNASTDTESTCFYFECLEKHLFEALDKFAQFFISPLMKKSAMTRERESIESEFQMALPSDYSRKEQLLCSFAKPGTPASYFSWGNLKTLKDNISDEKLYEGVHEFRKRHYSAHRMTLAIQARLPTETLQSYVLKCFSKVPSNDLPPSDFSSIAAGIFDTPMFKRMYYVKPMKDVCQVDLTWSLPPLQHEYKSKPAYYVSFLMGDEGKGSLLAYLKKRMWAITTSVGNGESGSEDNSLFTLLNVSVVLTDEGLRHLNEVIEVVFSYINLLKQLGPQERIYNEVKSIADTSFRFATEETAVDTVEDLCESMQIYPPEDYIAGSEIYYDYNPEAIKMVLEHLQPSKMNVMVLSKNLPNGLKFDKIEQWFGTEYTDMEIPKDLISKWENVPPHPELDVPPPNPYLTSDFTILPEIQNHPDYPQKIKSDSLYELWYRKDQKFNLPIAYYYFYLISPKSVKSAEKATLTEMLMNLLEFSIAEEVYPATNAELSHHLSFYERGVLIKVDGFNEKLPVLIEVIAKYIVTLGDHITEKLFDAVKDKQLKGYYNRLLKPATFAKDVRMKLLLNNHWKLSEKYIALSKLRYEDVKNFVSDYSNSLYVKALVQGNVSKKVASQTVKKFVETIKSSSFPDTEYPRFRVAQIPLGEKCCRVEGFNSDDSNSIVVNYYQSAPFSIRASVIIDLIMRFSKCTLTAYFNLSQLLLYGH